MPWNVLPFENSRITGLTQFVHLQSPTCCKMQSFIPLLDQALHPWLTNPELTPVALGSGRTPTLLQGHEPRMWSPPAKGPVCSVRKLLSAPCASTSLVVLSLGPGAHYPSMCPFPRRPCYIEKVGPGLEKSLLARAWSSRSAPDTVVSAFLDAIATKGIV